MIGAGLYSEVYPFVQNNLLKLGDYGKLTIPTLIGVDPWVVIVPFAMVVSGVLLWMDRFDKGKLRIARDKNDRPANIYHHGVKRS